MHAPSQYPLGRHRPMALASQPYSFATTGTACMKCLLEHRVYKLSKLGWSTFWPMAAACKGSLCSIQSRSVRNNDKVGTRTHQKPEGEMPLCEKFRAARCNRPGCASARSSSPLEPLLASPQSCRLS